MKESDVCKGLKVLDLSSVLAGPLTASFFAELGAQVLKIENKRTGGDVTRQWKLTSEDVHFPWSAYYVSANYGKQVMLLDLTDPAEREVLEELVATSDLVISNFQKSVSHKLDLLPEIIHARYPQLIFAQLSAYAFDDARPGYDLIMQGETGWISMNGTDDKHLAKLPVALIDILASHQMKEAILLALLQKASTGKGTVVHVSLFKSALSALANQASNYLNQQHIPRPIGTLHPNIAPYGDLFISQDKISFMLALGSDDQFRKLAVSLQVTDNDFSAFETNQMRVINRTELYALLQYFFDRKVFTEISELLRNANIPFCNIKNMKEVFEDDMAKSMVLQQKFEEKVMKSVSSIAFEIIN
jgi:crotonobetainyl-CoA:carnitine CoA-transferase CaiB-like acyl-CoA transferase